MATQSEEVTKLKSFLDEGRDVTAIVAPAFAGEWSQPELFTILNHLGFTRAIEVAEGAIVVNEELKTLIQANPASRFITSPCPSILRLIRTKYPELMSYLAPQDSPMSATAKLVREKYPDSAIVFIGPCFMKKLEAKEQYPDLGITVVTFQELHDLMSASDDKKGQIKGFTSFGKDLRKERGYPVSGGLAVSSGLKDLLGDGVRVVDGPLLVKEALEDFKANFTVKLLDILMCDGGCIGGPGYVTKRTKEERKARVQAYMEG